MNRLQKIARFNLIVIAVSLTFSGIAVGVLTAKVGIPKAFAGLGFLGICGVMGFSPLIFKKDKGQVTFDERDKLIFYRSIQITYAVFWPAFTAACMVPWLIVGPSNSISSNALPIMLGAMGITLILVQSLTTLVQYGFKSEGEKS